jgi:hypothetical protein
MTTTAIQPLERDSLVAQLHEVETSADKLEAQVKELRKQADTMRQEIMTRMKAAGIKSVTHDSGARLTLAERVTHKIIDEAATIEWLRKNNLLTAMTREVPKHREINSVAFVPWYKDQGYPEVDGIELKRTEYLTVKYN